MRLISLLAIGAASALPACATSTGATQTSVSMSAAESAERLPIDLRRTTLVVADLDRSIAFYRDALGMAPIYDAVIRTPRDAASTQVAERELRLVFLKANDPLIGVLGLMEYAKPVKTADPQDPAPFQPGDVVLVFNVEDGAAAYARAIASPGVRGMSEPSETSYPSYDGEGVIRVLVSVVLDPDGHAVELNQLLDALR